MKKVLKVLLIVLITIIVLVLALLAYVMIKNPLGAGDIIKASLINKESAVETTSPSDYDHPLLNEEQEARLIKSGVPLEKIPTEITKEQQQCGIDKLGEQRIMEIVNGANPSPLEMLKILPCL